MYYQVSTEPTPVSWLITEGWIIGGPEVHRWCHQLGDDQCWCPVHVAKQGNLNHLLFWHFDLSYSLFYHFSKER